MSERELFEAALDCASVDRARFLDEACGGDPCLRGRIEALLARYGEATSFLEQPALLEDVTGEYRPIAEGPGSIIGRYKLLERIGEGGFGVVYMAEQERPVRRMVALKIIKPGMDTAQVIARFESERQALAMMDHPHIAMVLDAGATDSGRPYFVMELVKGVPITEFCDNSQMPTEGRLKLFIDVCQAIEHAHHKGIIHRDIKPSNVMASWHGEVPVVKVIDFGVAKATIQKLTERTLFTGYGQMIGTPAYMSPEQAEMSGLDVDTRSDVYSLGVLLYELLTGTTPLEARRLRQAGYAELQQLICAEETPRPSTRLSAMGASATVLAGNRGVDVKKLKRLLAGDLDWLVMKALEKDRSRRYSSPGYFADDIARYLSGEAILARPPSTTYRLKKFVQRNRPAVLTAAAVMAAILAGAAVAIWQAVRATRAEKFVLETLAEVTREKEHATSAEANAKAEAAIAQAVGDYLRTDLLAQASPWTSDASEQSRDQDVKLVTVVDRAARGVGARFPDQQLVEAAVRHTIAVTYSGLGKHTSARQQLERALDIRRRLTGDDSPETLSTMHELGVACRELALYDRANELLARVVEGARFTGAADNNLSLWAAFNLGDAYLRQGRLAEAESLLTTNLAAWRSKGINGEQPAIIALNLLLTVYMTNGDQAKAAVMLPAALDQSYRVLGPNHPVTFSLLIHQGEVYVASGEIKKAEAHYCSVLKNTERALGDDNNYTKVLRGYLGGVYVQLGRFSEAEAQWLRKLKSDRRVLGNDHPATLRSIDVVVQLLMDERKFAQAEPLLSETFAIRQAKFGHDHPETLQNMWDLTASLDELGRGAEAIRVVDDCFRRTAARNGDPRLVERLTYARLVHFKRANNAAGCRETAEMWEKLNRAEAVSLYHSARCRAVVAAVLQQDPNTPAADRSRLARAEADRAMNWLKQAVAADFKNAAHIAGDKDLDALRDRQDFKALLSELGAKR